MPNWHLKLNFEPVANCDRMGNDMSKQTLATVTKITSTIRTVRGQKVLLDADLAKIYGVETGALNRAVLRNIKRFPADFMFQLTPEEFESLRCQIGISNARGGRRYMPYAFTENGAIMAANVLNSPAAVRMSVFVVRAFVQMRDLLGGTKELASCLASSFVPPSSSRIFTNARTTNTLIRTAAGLFKTLAAITAPFSVKA